MFHHQKSHRVDLKGGTLGFNLLGLGDLGDDAVVWMCVCAVFISISLCFAMCRPWLAQGTYNSGFLLDQIRELCLTMVAKRALKSTKIALKRPAAQTTKQAPWTAKKQREKNKQHMRS